MAEFPGDLYHAALARDGSSRAAGQRANVALKSGHIRADNLVHDPLMPCEGSWEPCTVTKSVANR